MGTVIGPIIGAFILVAIQNYFAQVGAWSTIIQVIFVACVLVFRHGIVGEIERWRRRQAARRNSNAPPAGDFQHLLPHFSAAARPRRIR
ncbi:MAG: hypothetical protein U1E33_06235 [Rhodospirillales bacterium]